MNINSINTYLNTRIERNTRMERDTRMEGSRNTRMEGSRNTRMEREAVMSNGCGSKLNILA